ncbi:DNA oxidative demethylase AlkB [Rhizobacter sp. SG703]|uniref:DNA oxidative demethylase AlkB n=1 Tax=Rhizobacter sp. SG703 TaxID=2587140 RepID=UPI0014486A4A|nr:alkylated DNA repair protein (DNA oxidative demethylase) [Rhizobacter sp. SG703]
MTGDLFDPIDDGPPSQEPIADGAVLLRRLALPRASQLLADLQPVLAAAPWRHLVTPGGKRMSVAMTNTGPLGWVSDRRGYRYQASDPLSGAPWPAMPRSFRELAVHAAACAGYDGFEPDANLINLYVPGTRLSLHQDRDEADYGAPIVSVSLGLPAVFLFGGTQRQQPVKRLRLAHGDVVVWGGAARLAFHGVMPLADGEHPATGCSRINLTFRRAGR